MPIKDTLKPKSAALLIRDLASWVRNPRGEPSDFGFSKKVTSVFTLFLVDLLLSAITFAVLMFIHTQITSLNGDPVYGGLLELVLLAVLIAPLFEELIFRFPLTWKGNLILRLIARVSKRGIRGFFDRRYAFIVYTSSVVFALVHISNFEFDWRILALSPFVVLPQFLGAMLLAYERVRFGFWWAVVHHALFNGLLILVTVFVGHDSSLIDVNNTKFDLTINLQEYAYEDRQSITVDVERDLYFRIEAEDSELRDVFEQIDQDWPEPYENVFVDMSFESSEGLTSAELFEVIDEEIRFED